MMKQDKKPKPPASKSAQVLDEEPTQSDLTRRNIIEVATQEFSRKGFSGARVDEIAELTNASKRMIYYYFENKEGLYIAVLENAYRGIRKIESALNLDHLEPAEAIRTLVAFTFDYQWSHEEFVRLVMVENIHHGVHLEASKAMRNLNVSVIETMKRVYDRGCKDGAFRPGLDQIDIHMTISALTFFNVSNRYTFSKIFNRDIADAKVRARRREIVIDTVLRYMLAQLPKQ
jgi:AcrR family transcriptional regulator